MKIADSAIQLYSQHASVEKHQKHESLTIWGPGEERVTEQVSGGKGQELDVEKAADAFNQASHVEFSKQAQHAIHAGRTENVKEAESAEKPYMMELNLRILSAMIERLTGKKIDIVSPESLQNTQDVPADNTAASGESVPLQDGAEPAPVDEASQGGLAYEYHESHYEYESSGFSGSGTILTEDGKKVEFTVELNMSREFYSEQNLSVRMGDALKDPLVVNFSGTAAELTQEKFSFDIDNDGHENQISFLRPGSGFLALDKNEDGTINDGSELFGPESGNGFQDLAAYDSDGNNWIDENDSIFNKLRIWTKDSEGNDMLFGLGEKGIGAIYLESAATLFSIKDSTNTLQGQVQSTGVFLGEEGGVGTVQQVDLVA